MTGDDAVVSVLNALHRVEIPYMLVGALSRNHYAFPRSTKDADIVLHCLPAHVARLVDALPTGISADSQMSFETVTGTLRHILRVEGSSFEIELFHLSEDDHDRERFARRVEARTENRSVFLPTAEDVIVQKLRWCRNAKRGKDYDDARDVTAVQGRALDFDYIRAWADRHGTRDIFEEIYASVESLF